MNKKGITTLLLGIILIGITVLFYSNFSLYTEYNFSSTNYLIKDNYIYNVSSYTSTELYKKYFDIKNYKLKIENNDSYISNGSKTLLLDKNNKLIYTFTNIIKGDIVSNGIINNEDITKFEEYLRKSYQLTDYEIKCLDINDDNNITHQDLSLLKNAINDNVKSLSISNNNITIQENEQYRLTGIVTPNYGINTNLKWKSNDEDIVTVDESGLLTAKKLGTTTVTIEDYYGKIKKDITVTVDNNIKLSSNTGILYVSDPELQINIQSVEYNGIKCQTSNPQIATCKIDKNILYVKALDKGNAIITVTSPKYGSTTYTLTSYENYLDFIPEYYCMSTNRRELINLEYIYDNVKITNNKFTTNTYFNNNQFYIESLSTPGREELIISDINNINKKMVIDIYKLNIPSIGAFIKKGTTTTANITSENTNKLTCLSPNQNIAECYIKDNKLYVTGISKGEVTLNITNTNIYNNKEYQCGETTFLAVVKD